MTAIPAEDALETQYEPQPSEKENRMMVFIVLLVLIACLIGLCFILPGLGIFSALFSRARWN